MGVSGLLYDPDGCCQLGLPSQCHLLPLLTGILGFSARRKDQSSLPKHLPHDWCVSDECEFQWLSNEKPDGTDTEF